MKHMSATQRNAALSCGHVVMSYCSERNSRGISQPFALKALTPYGRPTGGGGGKNYGMHSDLAGTNTSINHKGTMTQWPCPDKGAGQGRRNGSCLWRSCRPPRRMGCALFPRCYLALWINRQVCVTCQYQYVIRMHCGSRSDFLHNLFEIGQGLGYASGLAARLPPSPPPAGSHWMEVYHVTPVPTARTTASLRRRGGGGDGAQRVTMYYPASQDDN